MTDFMIHWVQENTLVTAVLAGLVVLVCRITRRRPAVEHALWVLVLVKFLMPPVVEWPREWRDAMSAVIPFAPPTRESPEAPDDGEQSPTAAPASDRMTALAVDPSLPAGEDLGPTVVEYGVDSEPDGVSESAVPDGSAVENAAVDPADSSSPNAVASAIMRSEYGLEQTEATRTSATESVAAAAPSTGSVHDWLSRVDPLRVWLGGGVLYVLVHALSILRFARTLRNARPASSELQRQVESLASRLGMRAPRTRVVPGAGSPLAWGLGWPTLLLPAGLVSHLRHEAWRGILLHELAHLRRRDHYVGCLLVAAQCIWWWNPVFWYVRRRLGESAELACDAWVVWAAPDERRLYAESLLDVARSMSRRAACRRSPLPLTTLFTSRTGRSARREFERRLTMILTASHRRDVSRLGTWTIALFACLTVPAWSVGQGLGSGDDQGSTNTEEVTVDVDVADSDLEVVEEEVVVVDLPEPAVVEVEAVVEPRIEVPVIQLDAVEDAPADPNRNQSAQPGARRRIRIVRESAGANGEVAVPVPSGDAYSSGVVSEGPAGDERAKSTSDRRIERMERDLQKLERSLAAVLSELRSLRHDRSATPGEPGVSELAGMPGRPRASMSRRSVGAVVVDPGSSRDSKPRASARAPAPRPSARNTPRSTRLSRTPATASADSATGAGPIAVEPSDYSVEVRTLTRATYKLPEDKARALAEFLRQNVVAEMEIETTGDTVTVTTSGDTQQTIERLIDLLVSKSPRRDRTRGAAGFSSPAIR